MLTLTGSVALPSYASVWVPPTPLPQGSDRVGWYIVDSYNHEGSASWLKQNTRDADVAIEKQAEWRLCSQPGKFPCDRKDGRFDANIVLAYCASDTQEWCIESLTITNPRGKKTKGEFLRQVEGPKINAISSLKIPAGSTPSLWRAKSVNHGGDSDTYAALVNVRFTTSSKFAEPFVAYMDARVIPYREIQGKSPRTGNEYSVVKVEEFNDVENDIWLAGVSGVSEECAWTETGRCGEINSFAEGAKASLSLRIGKQITGWLMGRLGDPVVQVKSINTNQNLLTIEAKPVEVPIFYATSKISELTDDMKKTFMTDNFIVDKPQGIWMQKGNAFQSYDVISAWKDAAKDTSVALTSIWSFGTTSNGNGSECLNKNDRLMGMVTTNSTAYEGTAPNFVDGSLEYKVASAHFNPDGSEFKGRYDLIMLKSMAQCLYGLADVPISATVTVVNNGREERISTTSLSESGSGSNKWLKLSAQGFTFSNPTLKVKLIQKRISGKTDVITTITCIKGKLTKKVSAVNPKCPTGYKKN